MKKLILNVDDLGISKGVNEATKNLYDLGIVKSATALVNADYLSDIDPSLLNKDFSLGIHFAFSTGKALTNGFKHIVDENGKFKSLYQDYFGSLVDLEDDQAIENELRAQLDLFVTTFGQIPSHIDSHHHAHRIDKIARIIETIANEINVKIRGIENNKKSYDRYHLFSDDNYQLKTYEDFVRVLENVEDTCEVMVHVTTVNDLAGITTYAAERIDEYNFMLQHADELKSKFEFISYRDL